MKLRFRATIGLLFLAAGLLLGSAPYLSSRNVRNQPAKGSAVMGAVTDTPWQAAGSSAPISGKPNRIVIPSLAIDLDVVDGYYNSGDRSWTLTGDKAQFATITSPANNKEGNTFIYGHNTKKVFAALPGIKPNAEVFVYTDTNHQFTYRFTSSYETSPQDSSLFTYRGAPRLTLQTCTGLWYQNRSLFTFELVASR